MGSPEYDWQAKAAALQAENAELRRQIDQLREDKQALHRTLVDTQQRNRTLHQEHESLLTQFRQLRALNQELNDQVERLQEDNDRLRNINGGLQDEVERLNVAVCG